MPPTRTVTPSRPARSTRSASGTAGAAPVGGADAPCPAGRARSARSAGCARLPDARRRRSRCPSAAGPSTRRSLRPRGRIANRRSFAVGYGRRTMPTTVARWPLSTDVDRDPGAGLAEHDHPLLPDEELRAPSIAQLVHAVDPAADRHEPPFLGESGRAIQEHRRRDRRRAQPLDARRRQPRRAVRRAHRPVDAHARPDRRRGRVRRRPDLDRAGCRPGRRRACRCRRGARPARSRRPRWRPIGRSCASPPRS